MSHQETGFTTKRAGRVGALILAALVMGVAPSVAAGKAPAETSDSKGGCKKGATSGSGTTAGESNPQSPASPATAALQPGLIVLNPAADSALRLSGNGHAVCPCIHVNSSSLSAVATAGNGIIETQILHVVGDVGVESQIGVQGTIDHDATAMADPMNALAIDSLMMGSDMGSMKVSGGIHTAVPGYYSGGIQVKGRAQVEFLPGVYYVDGDGLSLACASVAGRGVTFVVLNGSVTTTGQTMLSLSPPLSGPYKGVTLYQPPANTSEMHLSGGSFMNLTGAVYAPGAELTIVGNGQLDAAGSFFGDVVVVDTVNLTGLGVIRIGDTRSVRLPGPKPQCD